MQKLLLMATLLISSAVFCADNTQTSGLVILNKKPRTDQGSALKKGPVKGAKNRKGKGGLNSPRGEAHEAFLEWQASRGR